MSRILAVLLFFLWIIDLQAQESDDPNNRAFKFFYANDVSGQTDQYYTNGVRFDLTMPIFAKSPFSLNWLPWKNKSAAYHTLNFQYDVFTPDLHSELYTDRPFASLMMLGSKHQYIMGNNVMLTSELKMGIIGQATGAGKLQNGLHKILPSADSVFGWETQIRNDIVLNYMFSIDKQVHRSDYGEIILGGSAYLGSPYTKLEARVLVRTGVMEDYFNLLNTNSRRNWQVYIYGDFKAAYVAYNATLLGGPINSSNPYVLTEIVPFILDFHLGVGVAYKNCSLSLGQHLLTPEFYGADTYTWGELNFMVTF